MGSLKSKFCNEVRDYNTNAVDGLYLAMSDNVHVDGPTTAPFPITVKNGRVDRGSVERAAQYFVELDPHHYALEEVSWNGDGSFTLSLGS